MLPEDTIGIALEALRRHKSRSVLTTLGIIIGVGSVILMVSIGASFERYILDQVDQFGGNVFEIHAKGLQDIGKETLTITIGDYEALKGLSTVRSVSPVIFLSSRVSYGDQEIAPMIMGTTKEIFHNWSMEVAKGRLLSDADDQGARSVAVIGSKAAEELFPNEDPMGKRISIGSRKFTVVGVLDSLGSALAQQMDSVVYIPFSVAKAVTGRTRYIDYISLQSTVDTRLAQADIQSLLRQRHNINNPEGDPDKDDFYARSVEQAMEIVSAITMGITVFLGLIAGISLLVGGIGIMNIMLVSVSERTKEIGLRKAVGAKRNDILLQFLIEAIVLTLIGGVIGILMGVGIGYMLYLIARYFLGDFTFALSMNAIFLAVGMAVSTGLVFGIYPAKKAASLSPMEAIRWE
ncbi:MAG: ABC transporter permease [Candidatus Peribacteraceae bacterium]|nr:ABC transporter permease [Candidatus Peribacteraceae bacterium]